jgi:chlorophyllide a hydrolase
MPLSPPVMISIYWALGLAVGGLFFRTQIFSFNPRYDTRRIALLIVSLALVAANAVVYSHSTSDGGRTLDLWSVPIFGLGNGIAETLWFYAFFRLGETLSERITSKRWAHFAAGLLVFMIYSGVIHSLFWANVFPEHVLQMTPFRPFLMPILVAITVSWALSFFWYRDLHTVMVMHVLIDVTAIWNMKFSMFG